jgi:hypothetical protein
VSRLLRRSVVLLAISAMALDAQAVPARAWWKPRPGIQANGGIFVPRATGEAFDVMSSNLSLNGSDLQPLLAGGELSLLFADQIALVFGMESGARAVSSVSLLQPTGDPSPVPQQTSLCFTPVRYLGLEWYALRWRAKTEGKADRARLLIGAGGGDIAYTLHQWGEFVDAAQLVRFGADFSSAARAPFTYFSLGAELPLGHNFGLRANVRQQWGSAHMSSAFGGFDSFDLAGTQLTLGLLLRPTRTSSGPRPCRRRFLETSCTSIP